MSIYLSKYLPYKNGIDSKVTPKDIEQGLTDYKVLLDMAGDAISAFRERKLEKFDALVGENACQIRAVKVAMIASRGEPFLELQELNIQQKKGNLDRFFEVLKKQPLKDSLDQLDVSLTRNTTFLFLSYILTIAKKLEDNKDSDRRGEKAYPQNLKEKYKISQRFARWLTYKGREFLSLASIEFVQEQAQVLGEVNLVRISKDFQRDYYGLNTLPMFWTYKILLLAAEREGIPLILRTEFIPLENEKKSSLEKSIICFRPQNGKYIPFRPTQADSDKAAIYIDGISKAAFKDLPTEERWQEILSVLQTEVILAGVADHKQYPGKENDPNLPEDSEFERYKQLAKVEGFCEGNKKMFFIQHVYPNTVGNILDGKQEEK